mgnify:CR=1 FL=1
MEKKIYSIRDNKVGTFSPPTHASHETELTRVLSEIVQCQTEHNFHKYPQDYELFQLGTFNEETGKLKVFDEKLFILNLTDLIPKKGDN